jgi:hypothetical protein
VACEGVSCRWAKGATQPAGIQISEKKKLLSICHFTRVI